MHSRLNRFSVVMSTGLLWKNFSRFASVSNFTKRTWSCLSKAMAKTLTFTEVNEKLKNAETILLDVREPSELKTDGMIVGARNVPVGEFAAAFQLDDQEFQGAYGFRKPQPSDDIVVHCKAGVRAQNAAKVLMGSGYSKVEVYPGIMDWVENGGKVEK